jgi:hypothetical protein
MNKRTARALALVLSATPLLLVGCGSSEDKGGTGGSGGGSGGALNYDGGGSKLDVGAPDTSTGGMDSALASMGGSMGSNDGSIVTSDGVTSSGGSDGGIDSSVTSSGGSTSSIDSSRASSDGMTGSGGSDVSIDAAVASSDGSVADVSCDFTTQGMHLCTGFSGLSADAAAKEQSVCTQQNQGSFAQAACLTANVSATCTFTSTGAGQFAGIPAGTVVTYVWYSLSATQIPSTQQVCSTALGGSWSGSSSSPGKDAGSETGSTVGAQPADPNQNGSCTYMDNIERQCYEIVQHYASFQSECVTYKSGTYSAAPCDRSLYASQCVEPGLTGTGSASYLYYYVAQTQMSCAGTLNQLH